MQLTTKLATVASLVVALTFTACVNKTTTITPVVTDKSVVEISADITANTTWSADKIYLLKGFRYVQAGATLTIEAGTIIKGDKDSKASLIVKPGGKLIAIGTPEKPIVFTSNQAKGSRGAGDWGGLILLGNAKVNKNPAVIEGENISTFGGSDDNDNSGTLKYVRIEFAGIAFEPDKEINGLTFGGVGSGTTIDYVQVSYSGDDSYEWFGGAVNCKHLVAYRGVDDDFDTDNGFSGKVQYGVALRDPNIADQCACSSSNGFESDNDGSGSTALPQTSAQFANISIFMGAGAAPNAKFNDGMLIRRNSALSIYNSIVVGAYPKAGLEFNGAASQANYIAASAKIQGVALVDMSKKLLTADSATFYNAANKNYTTWTAADLKLNAAFNTLGAPKFLPTAASPLFSNYVFLPAGFETANYMGAFGTTDWTATWTNFDPQNTEYK
jgi:hypothetical protein